MCIAKAGAIKAGMVL